MRRPCVRRSGRPSPGKSWRRRNFLASSQGSGTRTCNQRRRLRPAPSREPPARPSARPHPPSCHSVSFSMPWHAPVRCRWRFQSNRATEMPCWRRNAARTVRSGSCQPRHPPPSPYSGGRAIMIGQSHVDASTKHGAAWEWGQPITLRGIRTQKVGTQRQLGENLCFEVRPGSRLKIWTAGSGSAGRLALATMRHALETTSDQQPPADITAQSSGGRGSRRKTAHRRRR